MLTDDARRCADRGAVFSVYFASSGVESLRIGLNRAYDAVETRHWWLLRLESIVYVLVGAVALLALAFLVVLAPLFFGTALQIRALAGAVRARPSLSCASRWRPRDAW